MKQQSFNSYEIPLFEDFRYNYNLSYSTRFNNPSQHALIYCTKISLNFGFKQFKFEKKQMVLYFFLLELFCHQKCILTTAKKDLLSLKIKKGSVTGCKLTLRNINLISFIDTLLLGLPRSEIFKGFSFNQNSRNFAGFSTKIKELFIFQTLTFEITNSVKFVDINFNFNHFDQNKKFFFFTYLKLPLKYFAN